MSEKQKKVQSEDKKESYLTLNSLTKNSGSKKSAVRLGRGRSSGSGKTSGRGMKGQKSRSGVAIKGFEGGQMPLLRRVPKRGFNNKCAKSYWEVTFARLAPYIASGAIKSGGIINVATLREIGLIKGKRAGIRLINKGKLDTKLEFDVVHASKSALDIVKKSGGTVKVLKEEKAS